MIKVAFCGVLLFLSLSCVATSDTTKAKSDQSADRIGGQGGTATHLEPRGSEADAVMGDRVGGQGGGESPLEERTIKSGDLGGERVGGQSGTESDPEKPDSEAK